VEPGAVTLSLPTAHSSGHKNLGTGKRKQLWPVVATYGLFRGAHREFACNTADREVAIASTGERIRRYGRQHDRREAARIRSRPGVMATSASSRPRLIGLASAIQQIDEMGRLDLPTQSAQGWIAD
jgi:hypothetical protein